MNVFFLVIVHSHDIRLQIFIKLRDIENATSSSYVCAQKHSHLTNTEITKK